MSNRNHENLLRILNFLEEHASYIRTIEAQAKEALYNDNDMDAYRMKLEQKAIAVLELTDEITEWTEKLNSDVKKKIQARFAHFAHEAGQALDFASSFYMSTLLHVMDGEADDGNDLEKLIEELKQDCQT